MSPGPRLDRRRFLALVVAATGASFVGVGCGDDDGAERDAPGTGSTLADALVTLAAAVRRAAPELAALDLAVDPTDAGALAAAVADLEEATRRDLAAGSTVEVAGWVLSTTEARLCLAAA